MNEIICKECGFNNDAAAKYCQGCGSFLEHKKSLKKVIKSFNFGSVAGAGAKGTSIAPLAGMDIDKNSSQNKPTISQRVHKSHSLEDGSWYCPYCGKKNKQSDFSCSECLISKP